MISVQGYMRNTMFQITSLAVNETTNSLAVGLSSGDVFFYKNDILKFKNEKPRLLHEAPHAISALSFKLINKSMLLFVGTEYTLITILIGGKDKDEKVINIHIKCCII